MDAEEELTPEKLQEFIDIHINKRIPRYDRLMNMYKGNHPILHEKAKDYGKPDNRLVVNFAKYIVDTLNGYFIGIPVKAIHPNEEVAEKMRRIAKRNNQNDNNAELSKMCSIYGHAYEFLYQDEDANTRVTYIDPHNAFVIYDDTVQQEPLYGVVFTTDENDNIHGTVYSKEWEKDFSFADGEISFGEQKDHYFGDVPLIEYLENEERQSAFENVETLINAYNKAISEKANDVDYFADAYMKILGAELDDETLGNIRDHRIINLKDGDTNKLVVEFLDKPNADTTQENLIERLERLIFQISMVANISDENFGTSSGIALKYKLLAMENVALMKERKFNAGMVRRFKMMFNIPTNFGVDREEYLNIEYVFTRNVPNNIIEEAEVAGKLSGITSKRTQLSVLSVVDNVQKELDRIEEEKQQSISVFGFPSETQNKQQDGQDDEAEISSNDLDGSPELKALNGAQITSVLRILEAINAGLMTVEQGRALLIDGLKIDEDAAKRIVK